MLYADGVAINNKMESESLKKLKVLIEALTHSGSDTLDGNIFKEVKGICKSSQDNILHVYSLVLAELKKNNSQIRLMAFQICKHLFQRSSLFRENVLRDLQIIFDLTTGIISSKKLPPPKSSANNLQCLAMSTLKVWVKEFGETYKKLKVAYEYFERCKEVNFETLQIGNSVEQMVENEQQRHLRLVNEEKIKRVLEEFNSNASEIESIITSLSNCLSLLLPPAEEFFIPEQNLQKINVTNNLSSSDLMTNTNRQYQTNTEDNSIENENDNENYLWNNKSNLRECGISFDYKLSLELNLSDTFKVVKTEENNSVIENAKDCVTLINNRYLPMVKKWIRVHCLSAERNSSNIKKIMTVKENLENILKKYNSLIIDEESYNNETDSDDEFEEVKKEGYEEDVNFPEEMMLDCLKKGKFKTKDAVQAVASTSKESVEANFSAKTGVDKFWECSDNADLHEIFNPDKVALKKNVTEFSKTVKSLELKGHPNVAKGKLCHQKDRLKVETDLDLMLPLGMGKKRKFENKNLTHKKMKTSKGALKILESKNLPGLIDVVKRQNNAYTRLSKKLFNRSSLRRLRNCE